ncbi:chorismate lyase [Brenneria populi subsp. brevivirga]|uniref:chorismate lyase n=1 Tax=Brenneria populi TaxID=1505588 RepID=UPI002E189143|nr:chorismate lyase [Brenneria populi subsp. brevivirga]
MSDGAHFSLRAAKWFTGQPAIIPARVRDWLMETHSMTRRLEAHCVRLTVSIRSEGFVAPGEPDDECAHLPVSERYWLREVVLYGDGRPWLFGRTLIPRQTLAGAGIDLTNIGSVPLGRYLFQHDALTRDYIHVGLCEGLWARRSRLRLSGHPLLLTELFLPEAPLYLTESREG